MDTEPVVFNGINGATGEYLLPPLTPHDLLKRIQGERTDPAHLHELLYAWERVDQAFYGVKVGFDASNLAESGWGVLLAHDADPALLDALKPLLDFRRQQASAVKTSRYRAFTGPRGYQPNDTKQKFLADHGASAGTPADPDHGVPYYLLLVADPRTIPYRFQYELCVEYGVGRLWFEKDGKPDLDAFANYARSVVADESGPPIRPHRAVFFASRHESDRATEVSCDFLAGPLVAELPKRVPGWAVESRLGRNAHKARLVEELNGPEAPALLFAATHGLGFPQGDSRQQPHQGALLCQDWPGPFGWTGPIPPHFYFAADDVADSARLRGLVAFFYSSFSAGTPHPDETWSEILPETMIAAHAFQAALPQRLLGHSGGGALAVIGLMDRAWDFSFLWPTASVQEAVFASVARRLMMGTPVGLALEPVSQRYAECSAALKVELDELRYGSPPNPVELACKWVQRNDTRACVIAGDPAVRLNTVQP